MSPSTSVPPKGLDADQLHEWFSEHARHMPDAPASGRYYVCDPFTNSMRLFSDDTRELFTQFLDLYRGCTFLYWANCTQFPESGRDYEHLEELVNNTRDITYGTLRKRCVQLDYWAELMGYDGQLRLPDDYHVGFHKSRYDGQVAYYVQHSGIEHIWLPRKYVECQKNKLEMQIASPVGDVRSAARRSVSRLTPS